MPDFKRPDTPLANTPEPDYRYLSYRRNVTAKDSSEYRAGFKRRMTGEKESFPSRSNRAGYMEAKKRGLKQNQ